MGNDGASVVAGGVAAKLRGVALEWWVVWAGGGNNVLGFSIKPPPTYIMECRCGCGQKTEFCINPQGYVMYFPASTATTLKLMPNIPQKIIIYGATEEP